MVELVDRLGVVEWISLGAIPAAVPHTRSVPIMGTESAPGLLRADVRPGPQGILRVPVSGAVRARDERSPRRARRRSATSPRSRTTCPGRIRSPRSRCSSRVGRHLGVDIPAAELDAEAQQLRSRLDLATGADETTRAYVERLEAMVDEERLPAGDELISEIERFLRDRGAPGGQGTLPN